MDTYHRHVICAESFSKLDSYVWFRLFRWAKRRHPDKSGKWIASRYFCEQDGYQWTFKDKTSGKALIHVQQTIKQRRHLKVRGAANPFDKEWDAYFKNREKLLKMQSVTEFIGKLLKRQQGCCPGCRQVLQVDEDYRLYYSDGNRANKRITNVLLFHPNCLEPFQYRTKAA